MVIGGADYAAADQGSHYEAKSKEHQVTSTSNQISAMIPLRQVATDIGASMIWNQRHNCVTVHRGNHVWRLKPGIRTTELNDKRVPPDSSAILRNGVI